MSRVVTGMSDKRILVAGIGNLFLGDDGFGVEVARRLAALQQPDGVWIEDFGIRGLDLVYALLDPLEAAIFIDTAPRGGAPGTLYLIEVEQPTPETASAGLDAHGMDPVKVLALAKSLGSMVERTYVVGCEPGFMPPPDSEDVVQELTAPVEAAVEEALVLVQSLIKRIIVSQEMTGGLF